MIQKEREEKIIENIGLVHSVANRFRNRGTDYEDLFQAGFQLMLFPLLWEK